MIISDKVGVNFLKFFSNDDSKAYFTNKSVLEKELKKNISPNSVVRAKRSRLGSVNELNIADVKVRSHSCPALPASLMTVDINRLCTAIKKKSSQARQDLFNISTHCTIEVLDDNQKELLPFVGRTPDAIIADSEMTLKIINTMLAGTEKIEKKFEKYKGKRQQKAAKAAKTIKYILSDLYNSLVLLEAALGRKNFRILRTDFDDRMRDNKVKLALSRSHTKCLLDLKMDSDIPELALRERQARQDNIKRVLDERKEYLILSRRLAKREKLGANKICRLCKKNIAAPMLLSHSKRCLKIMELYKTLIETNNWLLEKCKEASKLRNKLGFDTLLKHKDKQKTKKAKSRKEQENSVKEEKPDKKEESNKNKPGNKPSLKDMRSMFKKRRCVTSYGDEIKSNASKEKLENKSVLIKSDISTNKISDGSDVPTKETNNTNNDDFRGFARPSKKQSKFAQSKNIEVVEAKPEVTAVPEKSISNDNKRERDDSPSNNSSENTISDININSGKSGQVFYSTSQKVTDLPQKTLRSSQSQKFSIFKNYSHNRNSSTKNSQSFEKLSTSKKSVKSSKSSGCFGEQFDNLIPSDEDEPEIKIEAKKEESFQKSSGEHKVVESQKQSVKLSIDKSNIPNLDLEEAKILSAKELQESGTSNKSGNYQTVTGARKEDLPDAAMDLDDLFDFDDDDDEGEQKNFLESDTSHEEEEEEQPSQSQYEPEKEVGVLVSDRIIDKKDDEGKLIQENIPKFDSVEDLGQLVTDESVIVDEMSQRTKKKENINDESLQLKKTVSLGNHERNGLDIPKIVITADSKVALEQEGVKVPEIKTSFEKTLEKSQEPVAIDETKLSPRRNSTSHRESKVEKKTVMFSQGFTSTSEKKIKVKSTEDEEKPKPKKKSRIKDNKSPAPKTPQVESKKSEDLQKRRAMFFKKSKQRESATQYEKHQPEETEEAEPPQERDFLGELQLLRFAKDFYTEISKYGEELPKNWIGKNMYCDSQLKIFLTDVIKKGNLVQEVFDFSQEFIKKLNERISLIHRIKLFEKEDFKKLHPNQKDKRQGMNLASISFNQKSLNSNLSSLRLQGSQKSMFAKATKTLVKQASKEGKKLAENTEKAPEAPAPAKKKGGSMFDFIAKKINQNKKLIKAPAKETIAEDKGEKEEKKEKKEEKTLAGNNRKGVMLAALRGRNKTFVAGNSKKKKKRRIKE